MSLRTVEIELDRPRHIQFTLSAMRDCCRRLGGITFLVLLQRLEQLDLEAIVQSLHCGLRHEDKKLDVNDVERLVQDYMDREGAITDVLKAISEAIELSGLIRRRQESENGAGALGEARSPATPSR